MLTHVYIRGNVGDPQQLEVFDLNTGVLVPDVKKITIVADAGGQVVRAELIRTQHANVMVTVEPGPKHPLAGTDLYGFRIEVEHNPTLCATMQKAYGDRYVVGDNGQLTHGYLYQVNHGVSDVDLLSYMGADPLTPIRDSMKHAMRDLCSTIVCYPITEAMQVITKGGGARTLTGNTGASYKAATTCPECFGTGLKGGFMQPCSKGCSP